MNTEPQKTLQERINEGWTHSAKTLPSDKQTKMDFWEAGYKAMLEELSSLQSENDQLKKEVEKYESIRSGNIALIAQRNALMNALEFERTQLTTANKVIEEKDKWISLLTNDLQRHLDWFNGLSAHQDKLLCKSYGEAEANWDEATMGFRKLDYQPTMDLLSSIQSLKLKGK